MKKASTTGLLLFASGITFFSRQHQPMVSSFSITRAFYSQSRLRPSLRRLPAPSLSSSVVVASYFSTTTTTTTTTTPKMTERSETVTTTQIPCPPAENDEDDYSLYHLQQRTQWLIENHAALGKICLAIAGGGGHALSTLAATAGASQLLLEGTVTYDRASFQNYVRSQRDMSTYNNNDGESFSFSSLEAAKMASRAALLQGMQLQSRNRDQHQTLYALRDTVGLGSASTLKTTTQGGMSRTGKPSHGNIVATRSNGTQVCTKLVLNCSAQNRFQQDVFCSHMILGTLEALAKLKDETFITTNNNQPMDSDNRDEPIAATDFQGVTIEQWQTAEATISGDDDLKDSDFTTADPVVAAANRILSGVDEAVLLLPKSKENPSSYQSAETNNDFLEPLLYPVLPDDCLIFPGSFNPPHKGHVGLARAAISKVSSLSSDNNNKKKLRPLVFEISITNADKPAMDPAEVSRRVSQFRKVLYHNDDDNDDQGIPEWGILLTSAPLFADKVRMLRKYAPTPLLQPNNNISQHTASSAMQEHEKSPRWSFVIGTDTMVRVLNPKYYNNDHDSMLEAQRSMGADFVVGGRLDQTSKKNTDEDGHETKFVTGEESLEGLPSDVRNMFVLLGESDFRVDISSTELRAQQQS